MSLGIGTGTPVSTGNTNHTGSSGGQPPTASSPTSFTVNCNGQAPPTEVYTNGCLSGLIPSKYVWNTNIIHYW